MPKTCGIGILAGRQRIGRVSHHAGVGQVRLVHRDHAGGDAGLPAVWPCLKADISPICCGR